MWACTRLVNSLRNNSRRPSHNRGHSSKGSRHMVIIRGFQPRSPESLNLCLRWEKVVHWMPSGTEEPAGTEEPCTRQHKTVTRQLVHYKDSRQILAAVVPLMPEHSAHSATAGFYQRSNSSFWWVFCFPWNAPSSCSKEVTLQFLHQICNNWMHIPSFGPLQALWEDEVSSVMNASSHLPPLVQADVLTFLHFVILFFLFFFSYFTSVV